MGINVYVKFNTFVYASSACSWVEEQYRLHGAAVLSTSFTKSSDGYVTAWVTIAKGDTETEKEDTTKIIDTTWKT